MADSLHYYSIGVPPPVFPRRKNTDAGPDYRANAMSADPNTAKLATQYLTWFIPAMALQFALVAMGSALRAVGNF